MFAAIALHWDVTRLWLNASGFPIFHAYLLLGLVFAVISFLSCPFDFSDVSAFYEISWLLYDSVVAGLVCLIAAILF